MLNGSTVNLDCTLGGSLTFDRVTVTGASTLDGALPGGAVPHDNCTVSLTEAVLDWSFQPANTSDVATVVRARACVCE